MPPDKTLLQPPNWLSINAAKHPAKTVAIGMDRAITWGQLYERSRALARRLYAMGLRPGDQAALMTYNRPEYYEVAGALFWLDVGLVMVGYRMKAPEIEYIVDNSDSKMLFFWHEFAERILLNRANYPKVLRDGFISIGPTAPRGALKFQDLFQDAPDVDLEDLPPVAQVGSSMIYTSGTTGRPKGATRSADFARKPGVIQYLFATVKGLNYTPDEVHLVCCPLYHSAPTYFALVPYIMGGTIVLQPKWNPEEFLKLVSAHRVTSTHVVPTQLSDLMQVPETFTEGLDLSSLRTLLCGAAPLSPKIKLGILERFGPILYEYYGSTETGMNTLITPDEMRWRPTSVGRVFAENQLKILDPEGLEVPDGERGVLYIHNAIMMEGYYRNEQATQEARRGEFLTVGDVAIRDQEGYYYIVDRVKDMIIRGGVNIYPAEVEAVLNQMEGIADSAVVGKPDPHWGEVVAAFVVVQKGAQVTEEMIKAHCAQHMANHKIPVIIVFAEEIPRTPTGKVLKKELREMVKDCPS